MAKGMQWMGMNVSPSEAQLLKFAWDCPSIDSFPEYQRAYITERLQMATLLQQDIYRVAKWRLANG